MTQCFIVHHGFNIGRTSSFWSMLSNQGLSLQVCYLAVSNAQEINGVLPHALSCLPLRQMTKELVN